MHADNVFSKQSCLQYRSLIKRCVLQHADDLYALITFAAHAAWYAPGCQGQDLSFRRREFCMCAVGFEAQSEQPVMTLFLLYVVNDGSTAI